MASLSYTTRTAIPPSNHRSELRILFVAPYVPSRIRVRPFHFLVGLAERGHEVTLICPVRGLEDEQSLKEIRPFCSGIVAVPKGRFDPVFHYLRALSDTMPLQAAHVLSDDLVRAVAQTMSGSSFDVVHIEHLRASQVALAARQLVGESPPLVLDAVDSISLLFERALRGSPSLSTRGMALLDLARTKRYEAGYRRHFEHILVTSPEDRWALETLAGPDGDSPVTAIPNGVDLGYFAPMNLQREPAQVILSGKMSYHANQAAALHLVHTIMPQVWQTLHDTKVLIVGANPGPTVRALANDPRVSVTGFVSDLRPYLAQATIAVCPTRYGVGIQNKVLEAMAMGTPVITTQQTMAAITATPGKDLLVAGNPASFAEQIVSLLENAQQCADLGAAGRRYVEQYHSWEEGLYRLEHCYATASAPEKL